MLWYEVLLCVVAACFVAGVAVWRIIKIKKGKGCCDCASCDGCSCHCKSEKK